MSQKRLAVDCLRLQTAGPLRPSSPRGHQEGQGLVQLVSPAHTTPQVWETGQRKEIASRGSCLDPLSVRTPPPPGSVQVAGGTPKACSALPPKFIAEEQRVDERVSSSVLRNEFPDTQLLNKTYLCCLSKGGLFIRPAIHGLWQLIFIHIT